MMVVKTVTAPSLIAGTGLFADEFIPKGALVWEFSRGVDESFTQEEVENLPGPKRLEILSLFYAYISRQTGRYINCGDDGKYVNHSYNPNIASRPGKEEEVCYALHDIEKGEEITQDYNDFEEVEFGFEVK
jgi:SET domain-containing protein